MLNVGGTGLYGRRIVHCLDQGRANPTSSTGAMARGAARWARTYDVVKTGETPAVADEVDEHDAAFTLAMNDLGASGSNRRVRYPSSSVTNRSYASGISGDAIMKSADARLQAK